jgi:hypothetical protein
MVASSTPPSSIAHHHSGGPGRTSDVTIHVRRAGEHRTMTPDVYLHQVVAPALMAVAETMLAVMRAATAVALLGAMLVTSWKSPRPNRNSAFDGREHHRLSDTGRELA